MFLKRSLLILALLSCGVSSSIAAETQNVPNGQTVAKKSTKIVGRDEAAKKKEVTHHIKNIEFHRSLNGAAVFDVIFTKPIPQYVGYETKVSEDGYNLKITLPDADISDNWVSSINTKVFNTIIDNIKISKTKDSVIFDIHSVERISFSDYKDGNTLDFKIDRRDSRVDGFNIYEPITVSFKDTPIETVLQVLSEFAGLNLVISSSVRGNISIDLKNVPWSEVMNIVLVSKGLATKKMNSILYVAPAPEIAAQEQLEAQTKKSLENNAELVTEFIPLNYTTATAAQTVITSMASQNDGILSARGSITSDTRTNTLIVTDIEANIPKIKGVLKEIDIPSDQVLIESRIVEVNRNNALDLGFNYSLENKGNNISLNTFDTGETLSDAIASTAKLGYAVAGGIKLQMEIKALEKEGNLNEVAAPHLVVSNNETAFIKQGQEVPYNEATASGAASVAFKEAVLELQVTPQIAPDGYIVLELLVTKNSVDTSLTSEESKVPGLITREITTKIMTKDGQTIVIGGIFKQSKDETRTKIPLLGDIPYLGYLFSSTSITDRTEELLVFITPNIVEKEVI